MHFTLFLFVDVNKAIIERRSIRKYSSKPVEFEKITAVLESGSYAPTSGDLKDFKFVLVTKRKTINIWC